MARTSGPVVAAQHSPSKPFPDAVTQTVFSITPSLEMTFRKGDEVEGSHRLEYFIGSGRVGRSFLFRQANRLFQAPVSFYTEAAHWQLSPGFQRRPLLDLTRAIEPACLNCHTSNFNAAMLSFDPGIQCERCHGDSREHLRSAGKAAIVNPAKLGPEARDSVCATCHLTGAARVARFRADGEAWRPGLKLSDYSAIFLDADVATDNMVGVTSHFEKLASSRCQSASGPKMSCTTCHDPHSEPTNAAAHVNARCQSCHAQQACPQSPGGDCIQCHMPKAAGRGVDHSSYTDHSIPRRPGTTRPNTVQALTSFWPGAVAPRDVGMAHAILNRFDAARPLLEVAIRENPRDVAALSQMAQIHERQNREAAATPLYEAILKLDPAHATAAANLGVQRIRAGRMDEAISLWRIALAANPAQTGIRMNIAQALFRQGKREQAAREIEIALQFDPDQPQARRLLNQLRGR